MGRNGTRQSIVVIAASILFGGVFLTPARALPADPCNPAARPPQIGGGALTISAANSQARRGWQREGSNIELQVVSPNIKPKATIFVCFRWKLNDIDKVTDARYLKFVPSGIVSGSTASDKPNGPLAITAAVPVSLPDAPASIRQAQDARPLGVYEQNNQYPLADVRVLLYGAADIPEVDLTSVFGIIGSEVYCDMPLTGTTADSGIGEVTNHKNWQPLGGQFEFTATASRPIPTNAPVLVCFRWKLTQGDPRRFYASGPTQLLDRQPLTLKIASSVLNIPDEPRWWPSASRSDGGERRVGAYAIPFAGMVPLADARILVLDTDGSPLVDVVTTVGVTNLPFAAITTLLTLFLAFYCLYLVCKRRLAQKPKSFLLCIITTRAGFASLSQFQIVLWTFVVIASAAYVMALSGDLIAISTGTLVLLGISGSASVMSKAKSEADSAGKPEQIDAPTAAADAEMAEAYANQVEGTARLTTGDAKADADAAAREARALATAARARAKAAADVATAAQRRSEVAGAPDRAAAETAARSAEETAQTSLKDAAVAAANADAATRRRHPAWSDLVMEELQGRELDVTRVQMLYFTLVTAAFVLLKVITSYEIPVIPEGFLVLMGISNSVYVGSKFATNPKAK